MRACCQESSSDFAQTWGGEFLTDELRDWYGVPPEIALSSYVERTDVTGAIPNILHVVVEIFSSEGGRGAPPSGQALTGRGGHRLRPFGFTAVHADECRPSMGLPALAASAVIGVGFASFIWLLGRVRPDEEYGM